MVTGKRNVSQSIVNITLESAADHLLRSTSVVKESKLEETPSDKPVHAALLRAIQKDKC